MFIYNKNINTILEVIVKRLIFVIFIVLLLINGCAEKGPAKMSYWPTEQWQEATAVSQGFDVELLEEMEADTDNYRITNIMIVRNGFKVYHYFQHEDYMLGAYDNIVPIYSITKSVISALTGIAVDQGYFELDQPVSEFFPEWDNLAPDERRDSMTIRHLLELTTGWDWPEFTT